MISFPGNTQLWVYYAKISVSNRRCEIYMSSCCTHSQSDCDTCLQIGITSNKISTAKLQCWLVQKLLPEVLFKCWLGERSLPFPPVFISLMKTCLSNLDDGCKDALHRKIQLTTNCFQGQALPQKKFWQSCSLNLPSQFPTSETGPLSSFHSLCDWVSPNFIFDTSFVRSVNIYYDHISEFSQFINN